MIGRTLTLFLILVSLSFVTGAQTPLFTYQGSLAIGGVPANGNFDFQFFLFSDASGGSPVGIGIVSSNVTVTNGSFSVPLNFGSQFTGANRFLEIRVRPAGQGSHTTLTPRHLVTSSPYSIKSLNSTLLDGLPASEFVLTTDGRLSDARAPLPNSASYVQNRTTPQASTNFNISGNGTIGGVLTVQEASAFQKSLTIATTLGVGETASVGGALNVSGLITGSSTANVAGTINTGNHYRVDGNFALGRSRLDLFNTDATPRGFTFEVLNAPEFLVIKNESGSTLMTIAPDGKVGIGDNNPTTATLEIGGTLAVSGLGGVNGEHLCRSGDVIRACSVALGEGAVDPHTKEIAELRSTIRNQQAEIDRQRNELALLKAFVCSQNRAAEICVPKK